MTFIQVRDESGLAQKGNKEVIGFWMYFEGLQGLQATSWMPRACILPFPWSEALGTRLRSPAAPYWSLLFFFLFKKFLLLFNYSCMPFHPIPPPHASRTHLPPPGAFCYQRLPSFSLDPSTHSSLPQGHPSAQAIPPLFAHSLPPLICQKRPSVSFKAQLCHTQPLSRSTFPLGGFACTAPGDRQVFRHPCNLREPYTQNQHWVFMSTVVGWLVCGILVEWKYYVSF